ncbi:lipase family protein [uncultured Roseobacter sp.]|uniref:lipase family protein n=1 Tax=uncultured Roseobacter sp. TaxID=114847 RepID=UPI00261CB0DA|nr:lipase family protein [uncultured Roseobacter sp.]
MSRAKLELAFNPQNGLDYDTERARLLGRISELVYPLSDAEKEASRDLKTQTLAIRQSFLQRISGWSFLNRRNETIKNSIENSIPVLSRRLASVEAARVERDLRAMGFDRVHFMSGFGTQCIIAGTDEILVVSFRGTEPDRLLDILADLLALPLMAWNVPGRLHTGFWQALREVWLDPGMPMLVWPDPDDSEASQGLSEVLGQFRRSAPSAPVWICGHSLGGALATLAAARLVADGTLDADDIAGVYTFGQPRVGDADFAGSYPLAERHFRMVNRNDIVTRVPPEGLSLLDTAAGMVLERPDGKDRPNWMSRFCYRHVGRAVYLDGGNAPVCDPSALSLLSLQARARWAALVQKGPLSSRIFSGIGDHSMSQYNHSMNPDLNSTRVTGTQNTDPKGNSTISASENSEKDAARAGLMVSLFSSAGAGLLLGYLVGMAVSEVVGLLVGALATGLAALLGLNDKHFTVTKGVRIGTFCFTAILGALSGTYLRTHQVLSPETEVRTLAEAKAEYEALGLDEGTVKTLLANLINAENKATAALAQNETLQKAKTTAHFSGGVALNTCEQLRTPFDKTLAPEAAINNFKNEGGEGWADFAALVEDDIEGADRKEVLFIARDTMCAGDEAFALSATVCDALTGADKLSSVDAYKTALSSAENMQPVLTRVAALQNKENQAPALALLTGLYCTSTD